MEQDLLFLKLKELIIKKINNLLENVIKIDKNNYGRIMSIVIF